MDSSQSVVPISLDRDVLDIVFEFVDPGSMIPSRSIDFNWRRNYERRDYILLSCVALSRLEVMAHPSTTNTLPSYSTAYGEDAMLRAHGSHRIPLDRRTMSCDTRICSQIFVRDLSDSGTLALIRILDALSLLYTACRPVSAVKLFDIGLVTLHPESSAQWFHSFRSWSQLERIRILLIDGDRFPLDQPGENPFPCLRSLVFLHCCHHIPALPTSPNTLRTLVITANYITDFTYLRDLIGQHSISLPFDSTCI
jgi:hypothetical protein